MSPTTTTRLVVDNIESRIVPDSGHWVAEEWIAREEDSP
jgi:hypothetical protein